MRKVKYSVTRTMNKGKIKTSKHKTLATAFKEASKSLSSYHRAENEKIKPAKVKKARTKRAKRSKK